MKNFNKTMRYCLILFLLTATTGVVAQINPESAPGGSDASALNPESDPSITSGADPISGSLNPESDPGSTSSGDPNPVAPINNYIWGLGLVGLAFGISKIDKSIKFNNSNTI